MPVFRVFALDVWGNAAEGFEVNNQFRRGTVFIANPSERDEVVAALRAHSSWGDEPDDEVSVWLVGDGDLEVSETERTWAAVDRHGNQRWLGIDDDLTLEEILADPEAYGLNRGGRGRDRDLDEEPEIVEATRPLYNLTSYEPDEPDREKIVRAYKDAGFIEFYFAGDYFALALLDEDAPAHVVILGPETWLESSGEQWEASVRLTLPKRLVDRISVALDAFLADD